VPPKTFTGPADGLDQLIVAAAQYTYAESLPTLWPTYLMETGRCDELIALAKSKYADLSAADRPAFLNSWAICQVRAGSADQAMILWQAAIRLQPNYWVAYTNEQATLIALGEEEAAWRTGEQMRRAAGGRPGSAPEVYFGPSNRLTMNLLAELNAIAADTQAHGISTIFGGVTRAMAQALLHDPAAAALTLQTDNDSTPAEVATIHVAGALAAAETGDAGRAASEMQAAEAAPATLRGGSFSQPADRCQIAPIEEAAGHPDRADAVIRSGEHFVDCQRFRGDILDGRGDWPRRAACVCRGGRPRTGPAGRVLLLGRRARPPWRSCRCGIQTHRCQSARTALGRSAQGMGRCAGRAGTRKGSADQVRRGIAVRAKLGGAERSA
jgi:tetratricopeptide (TPR) repeat protein